MIRLTSRPIPLGKIWNLLIPQAIGYRVPLLFFYKDGFGIKWPTKVDILLNKEILTKCLGKKKTGRNHSRMLYAILNKSRKQHLIMSPISQTIQVRCTRFAGHCWRNKDELISDILLWTPTHGHTSDGQPAKTYIHQFCAATV